MNCSIFYKPVPTLTVAVGRTWKELQADTERMHKRTMASFDMVLDRLKKNHHLINTTL